MTTAVIRDRLITYLADADEKEVKEFYALLKGHVNIEDMPVTFTEEQLKILDERKQSFGKGTNWEAIHNNIRRNRYNAK